MRSLLLFTVTIFQMLATPATAGKTVERDGLVSVPVEIHNSGEAPILCQAEIAHWFATDLARIEPGEGANLDLHFEPATGTWAVINRRGEALPAERAWCGLAGRTYETRWDVSLARDQPQARQFDCRAEGDRLNCW